MDLGSRGAAGSLFLEVWVHRFRQGSFAKHRREMRQRMDQGLTGSAGRKHASYKPGQQGSSESHTPPFTSSFKHRNRKFRAEPAWEAHELWDDVANAGKHCNLGTGAEHMSRTDGHPHMHTQTDRGQTTTYPGGTKTLGGFWGAKKLTLHVERQ